MRKALILVGVPVAVVGVAIAVAAGRFGKTTNTNDKFAEDLQHAQAAGLDLAQAQGAKRYALTETAPEAKPLPQKSVKQGAGTKAIRSKTPTVQAAPEEVAAEVVEDIPEVHVMQTAESPTPAEVMAPAVPRPVPQTSQGSGDQGPILAGGTGRGAGRTDGGSGMGGIFGAIIRGGGVDGDNCDPRPNTGRRAPIGTPVYAPGMPVYSPNPIAARPSGSGSRPSGMPVYQAPMGGARPRGR